MTRVEALAVHAQLEQLVQRGPGTNSQALREAQALAFRLRSLRGPIAEKLSALRDDFAIWFSARRWQTPRDAYWRSRLHSHLSGLEGAIQQLPERG